MSFYGKQESYICGSCLVIDIVTDIQSNAGWISRLKSVSRPGRARPGRSWVVIRSESPREVAIEG